MKRIFLLAVLSMPLLCFAQQRYTAGYIIKPGGDTVKGYINVREWTKNPRSIQFKTNLDNNNQETFSASQIQGFYVNGYSGYTAYEGPVSNNKNVFPDIDNYQDTTTHMDTVFLKEVVNGPKVSLYALTGKNKTSFFYQEGDSKPVELLYYYYYANGSNNIKTLPVYLTQLYDLQKRVLNTGEINTASFQQIRYRQDDLIGEIEKLNGEARVTKQRLGGSQLFVGLGAMVTQTQFTGDNRFAESGAVSSFSPRISGGIDFFLNKLSKGFILRGEVVLSYNNPSIPGKAKNYMGVEITQHYKFKQYNFAFTPQVLFAFYNAPKTKIYAGGGLALNVAAYQDNGIVSPVVEYYPKGSYVLNSFYMSFPTQISAVFNDKLEATIGYILLAKQTTYVDFNIESTVWSVGVRYHFR